MFPFDAILFDVGGVLLTNGWDHRERKTVLEHFHLDRDAFEARHLEPNDAWERDLITANQYLDATVFYEPRSFSREEFLTAICEQSVPLQDSAMGILCELAASHKCKVGCLNNEARDTNEYRFARYGLRKHFNMAFSSCYVGLRKPGAPIYRRALDILGVPPERVLFIDDRQENVAGAESVGIKGIQYTGSNALRSQMQSLGVL